MPTDTDKEQKIFWNTLVSEIPAFAHFLINKLVIREEIS